MKKPLRFILSLLVLILASGDCQAQMLMSERTRIGDSIQNVAINLWKEQRYEESIVVTRQLCDLYADLRNGNSLQFSDALYLLALRQKALEHYAEARENAEKALQIWENNFAIPSEEDIGMARLCELCCRETGDIPMAAKYGEKVIAKHDMIRAPQDSIYAFDVYQLGKDYFDCHEYAIAKEKLAQYINIIAASDDGLGYDVDFCATVLMLIGRCCYELEDIESAIKLFSSADEVYMEDKKLEKNAALTKNFLGKFYSQTDAEKALSYYDEAEKIYFNHIDEYNDTQQNLILQIWCNKATLFADDSPRDAIDIYNQIIEYYDSGNAKPDDIYAFVLTNKGYCLAMQGDSLDVAVANVDKALEFFEEKGYTDMQSYLDILSTKFLIVFAIGDEKLIEDCAKTMNDHITSQLTSNFPLLNEDERAAYWNKVSGWYTHFLPFITYKYPTSRIAELSYNGALQSKGILLNSTVNIDLLLKKSDNPELQSLRKQWSQSKDWLQKVTAEDDEEEDIQHAYITMRSIEKRILKGVAAYGNFMNDLNIKVSDVKTALNESDLAVEFICSPNEDNTDSIYLALTLKSDYAAPHIIELGSSKKLKALIEKETYGGLGSKLYNYIWKPILDDAIEMPANIYFSADGLIYNIPIEYCATPNGTPMIEACHCYRVSSTRELVKQGTKAINNNGNIAIYGDIDYNAGLNDMAQANEMMRSEYGEAEWQPQDLLASRTIEERGAARRVKHLDGTQQEIKSMAALFDSKGIQYAVFDSCRATKESIKMIANGNLRLLHIATHGIYVSPHEKTAYNWLLHPLLNDIEDEDEDEEVVDYMGEEDEMMSRSALVMAGINMYVAQGEGQSDALLTAREISLLNLSGLDLAVLSACETALGDVNGEGVFGLQRGFKKAGTKSLLMSLMKVNDHATMLFINHFYEQLVANGGNKYDALINAIRYVRSAEKGRWNRPQFWASFILLDGQD